MANISTQDLPISAALDGSESVVGNQAQKTVQIPMSTLFAQRDATIAALQQQIVTLQALRSVDDIPPVFDQRFGYNQQPLDPRITFSRAGDSGYEIVNGALKNFGPNAPILTSQGWTMRPQITNLAKAINSWTLNSVKVALNNAADPLMGGSASYNVVTNAGATTGGTATFYQDFSGLVNTTSLLVKKGTVSNLTIVFRGDTYSQATFNFDSGTFTSVGAKLVGLVTPAQGGVFRLDVTRTDTALSPSGTTYIQIIINAPNPAVGNESVIMGPVQLNAGGPMPIIPTTTAAATRPADNQIISGANFASLYNAAEGAAILDFVLGGQAMSGNPNWALGISDGTSAAGHYAGISLGNGGLNPYVNVGGTTVAAWPTNNTGDRVQVGFSWGESDVSAVKNGGAVANAEIPLFSGVSPNNATIANLGTGFPSIISARRLRIFRQRPSDAQLQAWTTI